MSGVSLNYNVDTVELAEWKKKGFALLSQLRFIPHDFLLLFLLIITRVGYCCFC